MKRGIIGILVLVLLALAGCSNMRLGSTSYFDDMPYYGGRLKGSADPIGHFPVTFDKRMGGTFFTMDQERKELLEPVLAEMNAFLDQLGASKVLPEIIRDRNDAPDIFIGNPDMMDAPTTGHISTDEDEDSPREMAAYKYPPAEHWIIEMQDICSGNNARYSLYIPLGFSEYFISMKNWKGSKELRMGTGYKVNMPWMTDLDTPAEVLHLTGALIDRKGKIVRIGGEGIIAKRTGFWTSVIGFQDMISDKMLKKLMQDERRNDLPGQPLTWQVSLQNLVAQLTGNPNLIID